MTRFAHPKSPTPSREVWGWAMYDFANSGYTTVVLSAVYNAYFVGVVAGHLGTGQATLLWTLALGASNALVILSAPLIGAIADATGTKKRFLAVSTLTCVLSTGFLSLTPPLPVAFALLLLSNFAFATGENLISAFLPEIAPSGRMGRISAFGWALGYLGGLFVLGLCLLLIQGAVQRGIPSNKAVPLTMALVAICFSLASLPTFYWLKERGPSGSSSKLTVGVGFWRLRQTLRNARSLSELRRFLLAALAYACGTFTVIMLAGVYAQAVFGFDAREIITLMVALNLAAAQGAYGFGYLQDRWGSIPALTLSLSLWVVTLILAFWAPERQAFWVAAMGVGIALGGSQSVGRALLGLLTPPGRYAEFYGLWGMTLRLASMVGPLSYGAIAGLTGGNLRLGLLSTIGYFLVGLLLAAGISETKGRAQALEKPRG